MKLVEWMCGCWVGTDAWWHVCSTHMPKETGNEVHITLPLWQEIQSITVNGYVSERGA